MEVAEEGIEMGETPLWRGKESLGVEVVFDCSSDDLDVGRGGVKEDIVTEIDGGR
jgi:hypothetical protein